MSAWSKEKCHTAKELSNQGKLSEAIKEYTIAIDMDHKSINALYEQAILYLKLKKNQKALDNIEQMLSLEPNRKEALAIKEQITSTVNIYDRKNSSLEGMYRSHQPLTIQTNIENTSNIPDVLLSSGTSKRKRLETNRLRELLEMQEANEKKRHSSSSPRRSKSKSKEEKKKHKKKKKKSKKKQKHKSSKRSRRDSSGSSSSSEYSSDSSISKESDMHPILGRKTHRLWG